MCWRRSRGDHEDAQRAGEISYRDRLREFGLFILKKKRLWGDHVSAFCFLKGPITKLEVDFLQVHALKEGGEKSFN